MMPSSTVSRTSPSSRRPVAGCCRRRASTASTPRPAPAGALRTRRRAARRSIRRRRRGTRRTDHAPRRCRCCARPAARRCFRGERVAVVASAGSVRRFGARVVDDDAFEVGDTSAPKPTRLPRRGTPGRPKVGMTTLKVGSTRIVLSSIPTARRAYAEPVVSASITICGCGWSSRAIAAGYAVARSVAYSSSRRHCAPTVVSSRR